MPPPGGGGFRPVSNYVVPSVAAPSGVRAAAAPATAGVAPARRDAGPPVHIPTRNPRFVGNTPLALNVRSQRVAFAITTVGRDPPEVVISGPKWNTLSSLCFMAWQWTVFRIFERAADHGVLSEAEAMDFHSWCEVAYALSGDRRQIPSLAADPSSPAQRQLSQLLEFLLPTLKLYVSVSSPHLNFLCYFAMASLPLRNPIKARRPSQSMWQFSPHQCQPRSPPYSANRGPVPFLHHQDSATRGQSL
jgi:hypothetical protein